MSKSLKLFLVKPPSHMVIINPQKLLPIQVSVSAENVDTCFVNIKYDINHLELMEGSELNSLGHGSFSKQLSWVLKAIKISNSCLWNELMPVPTSFWAVAASILQV